MAMGNSGGISAGDIVYHITGEMSGLQSAMTESQTMAKGFGARLMENSVAIGASMTAAGAVITGVMVGAAKSALSFEEGLANLRTLGVKDIDALSDGVKELAMDFGIDLNEGVVQAYQAISASVGEDAAILTLRAAAEGAQAGVGSLTSALDLGTSTMNAWGMRTGNAAEDVASFEKVMGLAATAVKDGKTTIDEMGASIGAVAPVMAAAGITAEEFYSAVAALTQTGQPASQAMNGLKAAISNILKPSSDAADIAAALGIDFSITGVKAEGFAKWLDKLKIALDEASGSGQEQKVKLEAQIAVLEAIQKPTKAQRTELKGLKEDYENLSMVTGDTSEILASLFGSIEGVNAIISLTGQQNEAFTKTLSGTSKAIENLHAMSKAYAEDNPALAWEKMKATMQILAVEIGQALLPALISIGEVIAPVVRWLADFMREHEGFAQILTVVVAGLGALSFALGGIILILKPLMITMGAFKAILGVGGIATAATTTGTALTGVGTAATVATGAAGGGGVMGLLSSLGLLVASPVGAAAGVVAVGLGSIGVSAYTTKKSIDELNTSIGAVEKSDQAWAERLVARGVALDGAALAAMSHNEKVIYFAQQEKQADEELAIAYIGTIQQRKATEEEYNTARTLMMNKNISAEHAAIAATKKLSDETTMELLKADAQKTDAMLLSLGILEQGTHMTQEDITQGYRDSAMLSYMAWNEGTENMVNTEQRKAETVLGFWQTVWQGITSMFGGAPNNDFLGINEAILGPDMTPNAAGGPVYAGQPTIVGERGQEVFVPRVDGRILTHNQAGAMMQGGGMNNTISINVNANVSNDYDVSRMAQQLGEQLRQRLTGIGASASWRTA